MNVNSELELVQAEITFLELRLELLKQRKEELIKQRGVQDHSGDPYLPR